MTNQFFKQDHAKVIIEAEYVFLIGTLSGFVINFFWPLRIHLPRIVHIPLGIAVICTGAVVLFFKYARV